MVPCTPLSDIYACESVTHVTAGVCAPHILIYLEFIDVVETSLTGYFIQ